MREFRLNHLRRAVLGSSSFMVALAAAQPVMANDADVADQSIVVSARGYEQLIQQAPASISIINGEELKKQRVTSLAEALATVEGVDVDAGVDKTGGLSISIRGMPSEYSLILIDGRRQNAAGNVTPNNFGSTSTSFMPPVSAIERIEVVRGPVSTLYGSDAMGGVVNIITKKVADRWGGSASLDATIQDRSEFGDRHGGNLYINGPVVPGLIGLAVNGRFQNRDASDLTYETVAGVQTPVGGFGRSASKSRTKGVGGRLTLTPNSAHEIWVEYDYNTQWYDNSCTTVGTSRQCRMGTQDTPTSIAGYNDYLKFNREQYALAHNWTLPFGKLESSLSRNITETFGRTIPGNPSLQPNQPGYRADVGGPRELKSTNTILDVKFFSQISNHSFTLGGQYWDAKMVDGVAPSPFTYEQWALFAEDEWRFTDSFAVTLGGRYDHHSTFGSHFSPRAYAVLNVNNNVTVKGGVSRGFKTPGLEQLTDGINGFGAQGTLPLIGTPSLKPETSTSYEVALMYDSQTGLRAGITAFHNDYKDKIATGTPVNNCTFGVSETDYRAGNYPKTGCVDVGYWPRSEIFGQSINIDEAVTRGIEATVRLKVNEAVSLGANYTYTDSEQKSGNSRGLPLVNTPKHMLNANVQWAIADRWSAWARAEYRSGRFRTPDSGTSTAKATYGNYKAYEVFNIGGAYQVTDGVTLNAAVYNVFNKDFVTRKPFTATNGSTQYTDLFVNAQEPRRFWLSITADF